MLYYIYIYACHIQARCVRFVCMGFESSAHLQKISIAVVGDCQKANSPVIISTGFNRNSVMILVGEVFNMVLLYVLCKLSGDQCVFTYLFLGGIWWWLRGEVSLVFEDYCVFICVK